MRASISGPIPTQVVVLHQAEVAAVLAESEQDHWTAVSCSGADTQPGDRAVIFERGTRRVIGTAVASEPFPFGDGHAAWAAGAELERPLAHDQLLAEGALATIFRRPRTGIWLEQPAREALIRLIGEGIPQLRRASGPVPMLGTSGLVELNVALERDWWRSEREMQVAIASNAAACEALGVSVNTRTEVWHDDRRARFDLLSREHGVVIECKLFATLDSLAQLDGYLARLRASHPGTEWRGELVSAYGFSRDVVRATAESDDIRLTACLKRPNGTPLMIVVDDTSQLTPITAHSRLEQTLEGFLAFFDDGTVCLIQILAAAGLNDQDVELIANAYYNEDDVAAANIPTDPLERLDGRDRLITALWIWHELIDQAEAGVAALAAVGGLSEDAQQQASDLTAERPDETPPPPQAALSYIVEMTTIEMPAAALVLATDAGLPWSTAGQLLNEAWTDDWAHALDAASPVDQARAGFVAVRDALRTMLSLAELPAHQAGIDVEAVKREIELADSD